MNSTTWFDLLGAQIDIAPGFLAALDAQLRNHAESLAGVIDFAHGVRAASSGRGLLGHFSTWWYLDVGVGADLLIDVISALGALPTGRVMGRCSVGQGR